MSARLVLVSGLSGAGRSSILRALEDLGFEAVDNPPLAMLEPLAARGGERALAVGIDVRSAGFDADSLLAALSRLRAAPGPAPELVFAIADETVLLRRYTETRRRHPLAPGGGVSEGVAAETALMRPLREAADLVVDTSDLPLAELRRLVGRRFGAGAGTLTLSLVSFAFPAGLPREADMVFDARFLRNPHYDIVLKSRTGRDAAVGEYVRADPDFAAFFAGLCGLLALVLPRFVQEGKKYATVAVGCTGGRHRSVHIVESLARHLAQHPGGGAWTISVTHRELERGELERTDGTGAAAPPAEGIREKSR